MYVPLNDFQWYTIPSFFKDPSPTYPFPCSPGGARPSHSEQDVSPGTIGNSRIDGPVLHQFSPSDWTVTSTATFRTLQLETHPPQSPLFDHPLSSKENFSTPPHSTPLHSTPITQTKQIKLKTKYLHHHQIPQTSLHQFLDSPRIHLIPMFDKSIACSSFGVFAEVVECEGPCLTQE